MSTWWHVHSGPPWLCQGGATNREDADSMREVEVEMGSGPSVVVVESKDDPEDCAYNRPGRVVLRGVIPA